MDANKEMICFLADKIDAVIKGNLSVEKLGEWALEDSSEFDDAISVPLRNFSYVYCLEYC